MKKIQNETEVLTNAIVRTQEEIRELEKERNEASVEQLTALDRKILRHKLHLKQLKESQRLQKLREKGQEPEDIFSKATMHSAELFENALDDGVDAYGNDVRITASLRLDNMIERLELLKMANEITAGELIPDNYEFTKQFESYIVQKQEKVKNAREKLQAQDMEIQHIEALLADATAAGNPEEIIEYSDSLENARKTREYLEPMVREAEKGETFPEGTVSNAWEEICNLYRYEWLLRVEIINTAQQIHHQAIEELNQLTSRLKSLRYEIQRIGKENGSKDEIVKYNQIITKGVDIKDIKQIPQNDREQLYRVIYHNREELL